MSVKVPLGNVKKTFNDLPIICGTRQCVRHAVLRRIDRPWLKGSRLSRQLEAVLRARLRLLSIGRMRRLFFGPPPPAEWPLIAAKMLSAPAGRRVNQLIRGPGARPAPHISSH